LETSTWLRRLAVAEAVLTWREQIAAKLPEVTARLQNATDIRELDSSSNGWAARELAHAALNAVKQHDDVLRAGDPGDYFGQCVTLAHAAVKGAMYLPETAAGFADILRPAHVLLDEIGAIADGATVQPEAPHLCHWEAEHG
jgi:hypothetical protein